jgi:hypothetical protein
LITCAIIAIAGFCITSGGAARAEQGPAFSSLPQAEQEALRQQFAPPPLKERYGPYSTPMYYLMYEGYEYDGSLDKGPDGRTYVKDKPGPDYGYWKLDQNRPDWQEAMVKDWAELGLNNTHLNIYPVDGKLEITDAYRKAIEDFVRLSQQYGLKVGVRLDPPGGYVAWEVNPDNPDSVIDAYLKWVEQVATILKGNTAYYVLGDELTLHKPTADLPKEKWTPEKYLGYFKRVSQTIKNADPSAKVSMFAASSGEWFNVLYLLEHGYADYGDGVAINYYNYQDVPKFFADARKLAPKLEFYSSGVGYCSNGLAQPRYPEGDPYSPVNSEEAHGNLIAKNMFAWWDLGASTAPYYISLRNWVKDGKVYPRWFGFFGFEDFVIDNDQLTVKRYPGWNAFQTITHTFYNREDFKKPDFDVKSSAPLTMFRAYQHGGELLLMLWNDKGTVSTTVDIASGEYRYPVRIDNFDFNQWSDVPYELTDGGAKMQLEVTAEPTIIRLMKKD